MSAISLIPVTAASPSFPLSDSEARQRYISSLQDIVRSYQLSPLSPRLWAVACLSAFLFLSSSCLAFATNQLSQGFECLVWLLLLVLSVLGPLYYDKYCQQSLYRPILKHLTDVEKGDPMTGSDLVSVWRNHPPDIVKVPVLALVEGDHLVIEKEDRVAPCLVQSMRTGEFLQKSSPLQAGVYIVKENKFAVYWKERFPNAKPRGVLIQQKEKFIDLLYHWWIYLFYLVALAMSTIKILLVKSYSSSMTAALILLESTMILLPLMPVTLPVFYMASLHYANIRLSLLFEMLSSSSTPYKEEDDAFDAEAPAPLKNLELPLSGLFKHWRSPFQQAASWCDCLANVNVICWMEKWGSVAELFPRINSIENVEGNEASIAFSALCKAGLVNETSALDPHSRKDHESLQFRASDALSKWMQTCPCSAALSKSLSNDFQLNQIVPNLDAISFDCHKESITHRLFHSTQISLLKSCFYYWNKQQQLVALNSSMKQRLIEQYQSAQMNDQQWMFIYYTLMKKSDSSHQDVTSLPLVLVGWIVYAATPRKDLPEFIEDLGLAGIRFVWFSPLGERATKAFGDRLGLETDWNSCILLSRHGATYHEPSDIKARLPRGVEAIKEHLQFVDDIPLHVSLFAECDEQSCSEMIRIFQAEGCVVLVVGREAAGGAVMGAADLSILLENESKQGLFLSKDTSPYILTELIREARSLMHNTQQAFVFLLGVHLSLAFILLFCQCCLLPWPLEPWSLLVFLNIQLPLIVISFWMSPYEDDLLKQMPGKNQEHLKYWKKYFLYFLLRFVPNILAVVFVYLWMIMEIASPSSFPLTVSSLDLFQSRLTLHWFISYCYFVQSFSFLHRTKHLCHRYWFMTSLLSMGFMTLYAALQFRSLFSTPLYIVILVWPWTLPLAVQEWSKYLDGKHVTRFQKRSKLEFNTKLGMHSPV